MGYMCLFQFWFPHSIGLEVGLLGHTVVLLLVFKGISIPSSIVAVSIYISSIACRFFDEGHSDRCEVISHCSFDLHFSINEQC